MKKVPMLAIATHLSVLFALSLSCWTVLKFNEGCLQFDFKGVGVELNFRVQKNCIINPH